MKSILKKLVNNFGYTLTPYKPSKSENIARFLQATKIDEVLDVGANVGQFASEIRAGGFAGNIHSFEPLKTQFATLSQKAAPYANWTCYNFAFGDRNTHQEILIADNNNASASSFLEFSEYSKQVVDVSATKKEMVEIRTLQDWLKESDVNSVGNTLLKLDVQGFEHAVLKGAGSSLSSFPAILLEASFFSIYEDEMLVGDMIHFLREKGFVPAGVYSEMESPSGTTLQSDVLFVTKEMHAKLERPQG